MRLTLLLVLVACAPGVGAGGGPEPGPAIDVGVGDEGDPGGTSCAGEAVDCTLLGASFAAGRAHRRPDCAGWEVSACALQDDAEAWEAVTPALRDPGRWGDARCNDGTPFTFRLRLSRSGSRAWVFALRGGGFCEDHALPCWTRRRELTTAPGQADRELHRPDDKTGGVFLRDAHVNPGLADANHVFGAYCSSDAWTGVRVERVPTTGSPEGWYFAGRRNAAAMLEAVIASYGLDDADPATRVLWAGESAGCVGALATADLPAVALPRAAEAGRLKLWLDAAWLVAGWDDPEARVGLADEPDREVVRRALDLWGGQVAAPCALAQGSTGGHPGDCLFGAVALPHLQEAAPRGLGLPVFVQQSLQDEELLAMHGLLDDPAGYAAAQLADLAEVRWLFAADAAYHATLFKEGHWTLGSPGATLGEVLARFVADGAPERVVVSAPARP